VLRLLRENRRSTDAADAVWCKHVRLWAVAGELAGMNVQDAELTTQD